MAAGASLACFRRTPTLHPESAFETLYTPDSCRIPAQSVRPLSLDLFSPFLLVCWLVIPTALRSILLFRLLHTRTPIPRPVSRVWSGIWSLKSRLPGSWPRLLGGISPGRRDAAPVRPVCDCRAAPVCSLVGLKKDKTTYDTTKHSPFCEQDGAHRATPARRPGAGPQTTHNRTPTPSPPSTLLLLPAQVAFRHSSHVRNRP